MKGGKKLKFFSLSIILLGLFAGGLVLAQEGLALEVDYPVIPGIPPLDVNPLLPDYIKYLYDFSVVIAGLVAFFAFVYGGFRYITSAGQPLAMADAREQISAGIIGLAIILGSFLLLTTINPQLAIFQVEKPPIPEPPEIEIPPIELTATTEYLEVPIGTLIERILDEESLNEIQAATEETRRLSDEVRNRAEELATALRNCKCERLTTVCDPGCTNGHCEGDPCPNRLEINRLRDELISAYEELNNWLRNGPLLALLAEFNREATKLQLAKLLLTETLYPINYDNFLELKQITAEYGGQSTVTPFSTMGQIVRPTKDDPATFYLDIETNRTIIEKIFSLPLPLPPIGPGPGDGPPIPGPLRCPLGTGYCSVEYLMDTFGAHAWEASGICNKESGGNEGALNNCCYPPAGCSVNYCDWSVGLFQLNLLVRCPAGLNYWDYNPNTWTCTCEILNHAEVDRCESEYGLGDADTNIQKAYEISGGGTNWCAWSSAAPQYCNLCR